MLNSCSFLRKGSLINYYKGVKMTNKNQESNLKKLIVLAKERGMSTENITTVYLKRSAEKIFSLNSPSGEVNSYLLILEDALKMIEAAVDEDGYEPQELEIIMVV